MELTLQKSDNIGALASTLCMVHCFATPFIFIAQTCSASCCASAPTWWKWIDYLFLVVSFFAVYHSTKTSSNKLVKIGLWLSWAALFLAILNETVVIISLPEAFKYVAASSLVILHLYNRKYCQCKNDKCCAEINK